MHPHFVKSDERGTAVWQISCFYDRIWTQCKCLSIRYISCLNQRVPNCIGLCIWFVSHWTVTVEECAILHSRWSLFLIDGLSICLPQDRDFTIQSQSTLCISEAQMFVNSAKQMKQRSLLKLSPLLLWDHPISSHLCVGVDISPYPSNLSCTHAHTHFFLLFSCQRWYYR